MEQVNRLESLPKEVTSEFYWLNVIKYLVEIFRNAAEILDILYSDCFLVQEHS